MNAEQNPVIASVTTHLPWQARWCQADFAQTSALQLSNTKRADSQHGKHAPDDDLVDEIHVDSALPLHQPDPHRRADLAMRRR